MGDKIRARETVAAAGVPIVPGRSGVGLTDAEIADAAREVGLPVLLKPSAGGGGKGMRLVNDAADLRREIISSRREAAAAFGDDTLLVERFVVGPRHIEVQVAADEYGDIVHLGERECSLQRRHQKIEEAPSPLVSDELREAMGVQAVAVARSCGYTNVGTVELILSGANPGGFFFMEMNTRLQVEHPVTEEVYDVDLVELQLRIAAHQPLPFVQADLAPRRHAVEARVYAENPDLGFLPAGGTIVALREPAGPGIRVDSGFAVGTEVGSSYDPMLAKVIATADTRDAALDLLDQAPGQTSVLGVTTNVSFLRRLLAQPAVRRGDIDTGLVERMPIDTPLIPNDVAIAAAFALLDPRDDASPWDRRDGWRIGRPSPIRLPLDIDGRVVDVSLRREARGWAAAVDDGDVVPVDVEITPSTVTVRRNDARLVLDHAMAVDDTLWLASEGRTARGARR